MEDKNKVELRKIKAANEVKVGDKVVWDTTNSYVFSNYYWATVKKVTPKTIALECKDAQQYYMQMPVFRQTKPFSWATEEVLDGVGKISGQLFWATTPEEIALVEKSYTERAEQKARQDAARIERERERAEMIAKDRADAFAANPDVQFSQIGVVGNTTFYSAYITSARGDVIFMVIGAMRHVDMWAREEGKMVWSGSISAARSNSNDFPASIGNTSTTPKGDTLQEMLRETIVVGWNW